MVAPQAQLREKIQEHFSLDDLKLLCADLGIDFDNLTGDTKELKAQALIDYCAAHGRTPDLITRLKALRPNVNWDVFEVGPPPDVACPYRGLFAFREEDAPNFFGREVYIERLRQAVDAHHFVALVGPSGSGKSSMVYAGLLPRLRKEKDRHWLIASFRPGNRPFYNLATALVGLDATLTSRAARLDETQRLAAALGREDAPLPLADVLADILREQGDGAQLLLFADQFEELYTLCPDAATRQRFLDALLAANGAVEATLLLTLRADFFGQALGYRPLADALQDSDIKLGPMNDEELQQAVQRPAENAHTSFEPGLAARILSDVGDEPGNLPLLQFALTQLWERQATRTLTHAAYEELGRVEGALAHYADSIFTALTDEEQAQARRVFIQLVQPGAGTEDTRRLALRSELSDADWLLVQRLADERLVVTGQDADGRETVELVHEALIRRWDLMRGWMEEDRAFRAWQERLRHNLRQWEAVEREDGALLRGAPLAEAEGWLTERANDLSEAERAYIAAGVALREADAAALEEQRQRELEISQQLAEEAEARSHAESMRAEEQSRSARRLRFAALALAVLLILALGLIYATFDALQDVAAERDVSLSRQLASEATSAMESGDIRRAFPLAIEAGSVADTVEAFAILNKLTRLISIERLQLDHGGTVEQVMWNWDESLILTVSNDATARVWYAESGEERLRLEHGGGFGGVKQAAWNGDESRILTVSKDGTVRVWDAVSGEEQLRLEHDGEVEQAVWNEDKNLILTTSREINEIVGLVRVWDAESGEEQLRLEHVNRVSEAVWNEDESQILTGSFDKTVRIWDAASGTERLRLEHDGEVNLAAWNQDESLLLTGSKDGTARVWDAVSGEERLRLEHDSWVRQAAWNADESLILTASSDGTVRVWDAASGEEQLRLEHDGEVVLAKWNGDESQILTASNDETVRVWNAASGIELLRLEHDGAVYQAEWNGDESQILTGSRDGTVRVWNVASGEERLRLEQDVGWAGQAVWNADESLLLTANQNATARVWDVTGGENQLEHDGLVSQATWNMDGSEILTASWDNTARVWDVVSGEERLRLEHDGAVDRAIWNGDESQILTVGGSFSGHDGIVSVWDAASGTERLRLEHDDVIWQAVWNGDESLILTVSGGLSSDNSSVRVWDAVSGEERLRLEHDDVVTQAAWNGDESQILTLGADAVRVWDAVSGEEQLRLEHVGGVGQAVWNADESQILTGSGDGAVRVWDAASGEEQLRLEHDGLITQAMWNGDESLIFAVSGGDGTVRVWDAVSGEEQLRLEHGENWFGQGMWNGDESQIMTSSRHGTVRVWDGVSGEERLRLEHGASVSLAVWNEDESLLLTVSQDGAVRVWDAASGIERLRLEHDNDVEYAEWNEDESQILVAAGNTVHVYYAHMDDLLIAACRRAPRNLTEAEWAQFMTHEPEYRETCPVDQ